MSARRRSQLVFVTTLAFVIGATGLLGRCVEPQPVAVRSQQ